MRQKVEISSEISLDILLEISQVEDELDFISLQIKTLC